MFFNLNTPSLSLNKMIVRSLSVSVNGGTGRAGADKKCRESKASQGANSYCRTMGERFTRKRIEECAYVLTCASCFLGAILSAC